MSVSSLWIVCSVCGFDAVVPVSGAPQNCVGPCRSCGSQAVDAIDLPAMVPPRTIVRALAFVRGMRPAAPAPRRRTTTPRAAVS
jgi:hypothetical protein